MLEKATNVLDLGEVCSLGGVPIDELNSVTRGPCFFEIGTEVNDRKIVKCIDGRTIRNLHTRG